MVSIDIRLLCISVMDRFHGLNSYSEVTLNNRYDSQRNDVLFLCKCTVYKPYYVEIAY